MKISWTYSKINLKPSEILRHEMAKIRVSDNKHHMGGLERSPILTHCINALGHLFVLDYCPGDEIHLALIGGVDDDYRFKNTATREQLLTLSNVVRFYASMGEVIEEGDLSNFDLKLWLKAISK